MGDNEQSAPFGVALLSQGADKPTIPAVTGKTYGAALPLAAHGGKWDKALSMWVFPTEDAARAAVAECSRLYLMRAKAGGAA